MFNQFSNRSQMKLSDTITPQCVCLIYQWVKWVRSTGFKRSCIGYILLSQNAPVPWSHVTLWMVVLITQSWCFWCEFGHYQFMGFKNNGNRMVFSQTTWRKRTLNGRDSVLTTGKNKSGQTFSVYYEQKIVLSWEIECCVFPALILSSDNPISDALSYYFLCLETWIFY